jgi:hypothetical protein
LLGALAAAWNHLLDQGKVAAESSFRFFSEMMTRSAIPLARLHEKHKKVSEFTQI